ncbi:hypothetical protein [Ruegeria sp. HKCCA4633]|uniref:hypothetical protein n=1 Tax=Ruegeria sp. HKCCA4633 TaxID=2682983 RepID=UPI0014877C28|nr:hypothetical protein [Ruegeria sp. HKCCA4633]
MKNFPHQFANVNRLTEALRTASETIGAGRDFGRDDVFGPELARSGVYTFRGGGDLDANLAAEALKPRASRGTETAAREMRRFLVLAGFIDHDPIAGTFDLTPKGAELLAADSETVTNALWREAMLALELEDADGNRSHPYRILLRLVSDNPGIDNFKLMLAFESSDDSESEYERISDLLDLDFEALVDAIGVGESKARNAVKILPSIADQVGDLHRESGMSYPSASIEIAEDSIEPVSRKAKRKKSAPASGKRITKEVDSGTIAATPEFKEGDSDESMVDLSGAIELRKRRTKLHHEVVKQFAERMEGEDYRLFEDPFDCLAIKGSTSLLVEVKTLDGSPSDERRQSEKALGQIKGYAHFDLPAEVNPSDAVQIVLFSQKPREATLAFLVANETVPMWRNSEGNFQLFDSDGDVLEFGPGFFG